MEHARRAAAARLGQPTRGHAGFTAPFAPLGRSRENVVTAATGTHNMMQNTFSLQSTNSNFHMSMSTPAAARSPFSIRSASRATWASRCGSRYAWLSLWALTPPLPLLDDVMMCMGPRTSTRSRPRSRTAAYEG